MERGKDQRSVVLLVLVVGFDGSCVREAMHAARTDYVWMMEEGARRGGVAPHSIRRWKIIKDRFERKSETIQSESDKTLATLFFSFGLDVGGLCNPSNPSLSTQRR